MHEKQIFLFWFDAEQWLALGTWALVAATTFLFFAAWRQIKEIRNENRKAATLAVLGQYDLNPNLYEALKTLWEARESGDLQKTPRKFRPQIVLLLNHLDAIAIGIEQGVYIESLAWDHLEFIVPPIVERYIDSNLIKQFDQSRDHWMRLCDLRDRWRRAKPRFRDGGGKLWTLIEKE